MRIIMITTLALCLAAPFSGCGSGDGAVEVADGFWSALRDGDVEKARTFATKETAASLTVNEENQGEDGEFTLGDPTVHEDYTSVPTSLTAYSDDGPQTIVMETIVVEEDGAWKVDVSRTMMSMFGGAMEELMQGMTDAMQEMGSAMAEGMEEMGKAMADEMKKDDDDE